MEYSFTIEQILSLRLTKECTLAPGWIWQVGSIQDRCAGTFSQTATLDFSSLHVDPKRKDTSKLIFTVSTCGNHLMVARERMIYIYDFDGSDLKPSCNIVCPRKVMEMSMDASSQHNEVAALLDGRTGILANISDNKKAFDSASCDALDLHRTAAVSEDGPLAAKSTNMLGNEYCSQVEPSNVALNHNTEGIFDDGTLPRRHLSHLYDSPDDPAHSDRTTLIDRARAFQPSARNRFSRASKKSAPRPDLVSISTVGSSLTAQIPSITAPRSVYKHLGSDFDPPLSVAICPSRRCVAFGCSSSIELHWIDAVSEQELSRWFPLSQPADFLYFFPPREGLDSAKKLRIISSAAKTVERHSLRRLAQRATSGFSNLMPHNSRPEATLLEGGQTHIPRSSSYERDHLHSVPLSDGYHVLFTDPVTNLHSLGSDAPFKGPSRLTRVVIFVPPDALAKGEIIHEEICPRPTQPTAYASAPDLTCGVRIVAAYERVIILYSVPSDIFAQSFVLRQEQTGTAAETAEVPSAVDSCSFAASSVSLLHTSSLNTDWLNMVATAV